jgi:ACS family D-galactonate transporter-like MFS transporter
MMNSSKLRWSFATLLASGILVNYVDRITLSVVAPFVSKEFSLNEFELGILFSAFAWTYSLSQIPMGFMLDKFGAKTIGRIATFGWALAALSTALATGFGGLLCSRLLLGLAEAPIFPIASKIVSIWFPVNQRGLATAVFDSAAKLANVIGLPILAILTLYFGWRGAFVFTAIISFVYFCVFWLVYADKTPSEVIKNDTSSTTIKQEPAIRPISRRTTGNLRSLFVNKTVWGMILGFAAYGFAFSLFLSWMPQMIGHSLKLNLSNTALLGAVPWIFATVFEMLVGGWLIDSLVNRGQDPIRIRKVVLVVGFLLGLTAFFVTKTNDGFWMMLWFTLSLTGLAITSPVFWSLPGLVAPENVVGTLGGILNCSNNLAGAIAPIFAGCVFTLTGSFDLALIVASILLLVGLFCAITMIDETSNVKAT